MICLLEKKKIVSFLLRPFYSQPAFEMVIIAIKTAGASYVRERSSDKAAKQKEGEVTTR